MTNKNYIFICLAAFIASLILFAYQKEYIIINFGTRKPLAPAAIAAQKQNVPIYFWYQNGWHTEQVSLLFSDNSAANMRQLVSRWAQLLYEERITKKKISLQSATITFDTQELIVSLDRLPWSKENSTFDKWMAIEGLLKTIKMVDPSIKRVRFLVNQQPAQDSHLDFTNPWPITGFA